MRDLSDMIARTDGLRAEAEQALERLVASHPDDVDAQYRLAEIRRQNGALELAAADYGTVLRLDPRHPQARYLAAILSGQPADPASLAGSIPTPWVRRRAFLARDELAGIWDLVRRKVSSFRASSTTPRDEAVDPDYRSSQVLADEQIADVASWFVPRVHEALASALPILGIEPFRISRTEIQLTRHADGAFFKMHRDRDDRADLRTRNVTFVYYFHREPKRFDGGDLVLLDTDGEEEGALQFTRLHPVRNSLVLFPSDCLHQVTPVRCPTGGFEDGRFTLNGWLHGDGAAQR